MMWRGRFLLESIYLKVDSKHIHIVNMVLRMHAYRISILTVCDPEKKMLIFFFLFFSGDNGTKGHHPHQFLRDLKEIL